jgi:hypothetical protein
MEFRLMSMTRWAGRRFNWRFWPGITNSYGCCSIMARVLKSFRSGRVRSELWIRVDLSEQRAYVFKGEEEILNTGVSTGKSGYHTRTGKFVITNKDRDWKSTIYESSVPYFQRLSASDFGFHVGHVADAGGVDFDARVVRKNKLRSRATEFVF